MSNIVIDVVIRLFLLGVCFFRNELCCWLDIDGAGEETKEILAIAQWSTFN